MKVCELEDLSLLTWITDFDVQGRPRRFDARVSVGAVPRKNENIVGSTNAWRALPSKSSVLIDGEESLAGRQVRDEFLSWSLRLGI